MRELFHFSRQRLVMRKQQKADSEAEERKRLAVRNFTENKERFKAQKKKQVDVSEGHDI